MSQILWVDDEIDLLQPYIIYLKGKGYDVITATNGEDALDAFSSQSSAISIVFLDAILSLSQVSKTRSSPWARHLSNSRQSISEA